MSSNPNVSGSHGTRSWPRRAGSSTSCSKRSLSSRERFAIRSRDACHSTRERSIWIRWRSRRTIFERFRSIKIAACGTSWHAALAGKYMIEQLARVPVEVDYASEFRYRDPVLSEDDLLIVISQSGETADTIAAMREARSAGCKVLAVCNVQGSMIHREADGTILTHAGPEIGVASTKAFTAQMVALYLFALYLGQLRGTIDEERAKSLATDLAELPLKIETVLNNDDVVEELSKEFFRVQDFLYLGRGINFPVALEGALKLKEISYIHAEGYPAGEMKHGPNALIDEKLPVVVVNTKEYGNETSELRYEKTHSNIVEVKARDGIVIAVLTEGDTMSAKVANYVIEVPEASDLLSPILSVVPLQLLSYHIAVRRGCDVDQPRNLAKSVTVESDVRFRNRKSPSVFYPFSLCFFSSRRLPKPKFKH